MRQVRIIQVPAGALAAAAPLWAVIESLWPVRFTEALAGSVAARIATPGAHLDGPCPWTLIVPPDDAGAQATAPSATEVHFADDPAVPWPFRARRVSTRLAVAAQGLVPEANELVLASDAAGRALWCVGGSGGSRVYRSALPLPDIASGQILAQAAGGEQFIQVLPLFHFVREVSGALAHQLPPLRASFIVDDPNLHWPTYGHADYRAIADHADRENYHVAFATIPLDTWYTHRATAALFRDQRRRLSLLVHGNDHSHNELASVESTAACVDLLRHAIARIEALECKSGLQVCRVMVPPHGACSAAMLTQLPGAGFEAICVSVGSLLARNPGRAWTRSIGFAPGELIEGCPVLPRWSLTAVTHDVLLAAAYLGQALILRAHHQDLREGLEVFGDAARFINSLGPVHWDGLSGLARLNFRWRLDGSTCRLQPIGTAIAFEAPPGTTELIIEGSAHAWRLAGSPPDPGSQLPADRPIAADAGQTIDLRRLVDRPGEAAAGRTRRTSSRLILRRLLTEARDRLLVR